MSWEILLADGSAITINDQITIDKVHTALGEMSVINIGRTIPIIAADKRTWDIVVRHIVAIHG